VPRNPAGVDDSAVEVVGLGAGCDFVTEDEYRQRLVRDGWPADEVETLVEDFKRGVSFSSMSSLTLPTDAASLCTRIGGSPVSPWRAADPPRATSGTP
jgi:hypothetical protein